MHENLGKNIMSEELSLRIIWKNQEYIQIYMNFVEKFIKHLILILSDLINCKIFV